MEASPGGGVPRDYYGPPKLITRAEFLAARDRLVPALDAAKALLPPLPAAALWPCWPGWTTSAGSGCDGTGSPTGFVALHRIGDHYLGQGSGRANTSMPAGFSARCGGSGSRCNTTQPRNVSAGTPSSCNFSFVSVSPIVGCDNEAPPNAGSRGQSPRGGWAPMGGHKSLLGLTTTPGGNPVAPPGTRPTASSCAAARDSRWPTREQVAVAIDRSFQPTSPRGPGGCSPSPTNIKRIENEPGLPGRSGQEGVGQRGGVVTSPSRTDSPGGRLMVGCSRRYGHRHPPDRLAAVIARGRAAQRPGTARSGRSSGLRPGPAVPRWRPTTPLWTVCWPPGSNRV